MENKTVLITGSGLGSLASALRLAKRGYKVTILEKNNTAGGRLNILKTQGYTFDFGPSFFSMSYEFKELFDDIGETIPFELVELDPIYTVNIAGKKDFIIYKDLAKLALQFEDVEPDFERKARKYLKSAAEIFHDTEYKIIKRNFNGILDYMLSMATVPKKHLPKMFRSFWKELERHFESEEVKIIFSLVAFFLGATPFNTPSVYNLLNYTELQHDGYWNVKGGMYKIVEGILGLFPKYNIDIIYNTEIVGFDEDSHKQLLGLTDKNGKKWTADIYVINGDAASFRGQIFNRKKYTEKRLDKMEWTLAPFTMYLGVKGKIPKLAHHSYFLGENFNEYADKVFRSDVTPKKPYYYVNAASKSNPECAPEGCENLFILCPVPDLRIKPDWSDAEELVEEILTDLSKRVNFDIVNNLECKVVYTPKDWEKMFNLYKGSGLGLAHGLNQIGALRPSNKDEQFNNVYYVGASTHPGTGLPIVIIGSKLITERIENEHRII